jgi:hypothetical protein
MKSLKEQIAGKCRHFNGIMNETCKAGIAYEDIRSDDKPFRFPCIDRDFHNCSSASFLTDEEVEEEIKEINTSTAKVIGVLMVIKKDNSNNGTVPCACGGTVHYVRAQLNGHVHAKCDTCDLSFME